MVLGEPVVNGTQTRTVTGYPAGCTGGVTLDATTQACTTPCTSSTDGAWGACVNGTQTRTVTGYPAGCAGGVTLDATTQACSNGSGTHTITASAGSNGSISPSGTISGVVHNSTQSFTVTHSNKYIAVMSGTCGGNLVGTKYTTNPITADCMVTATFNPD